MGGNEMSWYKLSTALVYSLCHAVELLSKIRLDYLASRQRTFFNTEINSCHWDATLQLVSQYLAIFFSGEQAKSECDLIMMWSVFVASESNCFFLRSRKQISLVKNRF